MNVEFLPGDMVRFDNCELVWRNFSGAPDRFNPNGTRPNFSIKIDDPDIAQELSDKGWNVKVARKRDDDDPFRATLKVNIKLDPPQGIPAPEIYLVLSNDRNNGIRLRSEDLAILDECEIIDATVFVRPYDWSGNNGSGRTAYVKEMEVVKQVSYFAERYGSQEPITHEETLEDLNM